MRSSWVLLAALATSGLAADCYYPDGSKATDYNYQPCGTTNTTFSTCCYFGEGDLCLENGLCKYPGKYDYYRATCANQDWSGCPAVCMDESPDNWLGLIKCGSNKYCCPGSGSNCCTNGAKIYTLDATNPNATSASGTSAGSSSTASSSGDRLTSGTSASETNSGSGGGSVSKAAIAGGVVGGVAIIGLIFFGFCCFKRRKRAAPAKANGSSDGTVTGTGAGAGDGGAGGGGGDKWDSADPPPSDQTTVAEVEGNPGKVFVEVDSRPVDDDEKKAHDAYTARSPSRSPVQSPVQIALQQEVGEFEGSPGTVFAEADSTPVHDAGLGDETTENQRSAHRAANPANPATSPAQQQGFAEVAGSQGNVFTEMDSTPVSHATFDADMAYSGQTSLGSVQHFHLPPQQGGAHGQGRAGDILVQPVTWPFVQAGFHETNPFSGHTAVNMGQQSQLFPRMGVHQAQTTSFGDNSASHPRPPVGPPPNFEQFRQFQQQQQRQQQQRPGAQGAGQPPQFGLFQQFQQSQQHHQQQQQRPGVQEGHSTPVSHTAQRNGIPAKTAMPSQPPFPGTQTLPPVLLSGLMSPLPPMGGKTSMGGQTQMGGQTPVGGQTLVGGQMDPFHGRPPSLTSGGIRHDMVFSSSSGTFPQQQPLAEVQGNSSRTYVEAEADSITVNTNPQLNGSTLETASRRTVAEADGTALSEAYSTPVARAGSEESQWSD